MRTLVDNKDISALLEREGELTVADFVTVYPDVPAATVHSRIRSLLIHGELTQVGRGKYVATCKPIFYMPITDWMREINGYLIEQCEGVNHCISQHGRNLLVEVPRNDISLVENCLKCRYPRTVRKKYADRFPAYLEGYIIIDVLISDAPLLEVSGCRIPSLEKRIVDSMRIDSPLDRKEVYQKIMEVYPVNKDKMHRYAGRRGISEELDSLIMSLDFDRIKMFSSIQKYFSMSKMVTRAWVFGSFARMEETKDSDLDLLVDYDPEQKISLLDVVRQKLDLEKIVGREVDLVENGSLKAFAVPSAERDKYLIYER